MKQSLQLINLDIDNETLGGATTHCEISGVTDYKCKNDENAISLVRDLINDLEDKNGNKF